MMLMGNLRIPNTFPSTCEEHLESEWNQVGLPLSSVVAAIPFCQNSKGVRSFTFSKS